jgi:hypothetical protein
MNARVSGKIPQCRNFRPVTPLSFRSLDPADRSFASPFAVTLLFTGSQ